MEGSRRIPFRWASSGLITDMMAFASPKRSTLQHIVRNLSDSTCAVGENGTTLFEVNAASRASKSAWSSCFDR